MNLKLVNVSKTFKGEIHAVKNISLEITSGIVGFLGPNGAGKSTLMDMITTLSRPSAGTIFWKDVDLAKNPFSLRKELGYLPQETPIYPELSAFEFLAYIGVIKGIGPKESRERAKDLLNLVNLYDVKDRKLGAYSGGMKRRVGIAQALMNDPKLLIVDEPTVGLDPSERSNFKNLLSSLASDKVIILSSHILPDIEAVADNIVIVRKGEMVINESAVNLIKNMDGKVWTVKCDKKELENLKKQFLVTEIKLNGTDYLVRIISDEKPQKNVEQAVSGLEDAYHFYINKA